jgi:hypothetical protein
MQILKDGKMHKRILIKIIEINSEKINPSRLLALFNNKLNCLQ